MKQRKCVSGFHDEIQIVGFGLRHQVLRSGCQH